MRYPSLVRPGTCRTEIEVKIYGQDVNEDGEQVALFNKSLRCNYQGSGRSKKDEKHHSIELSGVALFTGDPFEEVKEITSGKVVLNGEERTIYKGYKERNPDGTINYTRLELV